MGVGLLDEQLYEELALNMCGPVDSVLMALQPSAQATDVVEASDGGHLNDEGKSQSSPDIVPDSISLENTSSTAAMAEKKLGQPSAMPNRSKLNKVGSVLPTGRVSLREMKKLARSKMCRARSKNK